MSSTPNTKMTKQDSQKTPGGISKSLLTPCRRIGLSKKWRKSGVSPFISPLATDSGYKNVKSEEIQQKKTHPISRDKKKDEEEVIEDKRKNVNDEELIEEKENSVVNCTPKSIAILKRGQSKLITKVIRHNKTQPTEESEKLLIPQTLEDPVTTEDKQPNVSKPANSSSIKKPTKVSNKATKPNDVTSNNFQSEQSKKERSPNNLTKECIVVIQKKINKKTSISDSKTEEPDINPVSQSLFDSDTDDTPLSKINQTTNVIADKKRKLPIDDDEDFCPVKTSSKVKKLEDKITSTGDLRKLHNKKVIITKSVPKLQLSQSSNSFDEDEEDFVPKKTIVIKKSYNKPTKPVRAKTTGSITQKDIDELKAQIECKKNAVLARAMTKDTEELRILIKKWKKGCQDALVELMDLMKRKFPDKPNMDYSEILQMLKIPSNLVGYDSDNDCFLSPDDNSIILATLDV